MYIYAYIYIIYPRTYACYISIYTWGACIHVYKYIYIAPGGRGFETT